jgi:acetylglutamate kinase
MDKEVAAPHTPFSGRSLVVRIDHISIADARSTFIEDLHVLAESAVRTVVVAPDSQAAQELVRTVNRSTNVAVALSGADAALLPGAPGGLGRVQTGILVTLLDAGYLPVIEPTAFRAFGDDHPLIADDVAAAVAAALEAVRAIFFHAAGGVADPQTNAVIDELTPAEALALADDLQLAEDLRCAMRAAATGVRAGVPAAQIIDGRRAHATIVELLTARHIGTQVTGGIVLAA